MTRVIGLLNYKGGTGKTTTVVNLGAGLAARGERVLCIDLDAQSGLASSLGVEYHFSLAHLLLGQADPRACIVRARQNLDIVASDRALFETEGELWRVDDNWKARRRLAEKMSAVEGYDYVLLDFSPSLSLISESGLIYAQELMVPVAMNYMALVGVRQVVDTLKVISQIPGHRVRLTWIVPTFYRDSQRKDREVLELLETYFAGKVTKPIRDNVKLSEAPSYGMTIFEYAAQSPGAEDYWHLVERVADHG